jgi:YD repeat-containing protein
MVNNGVYNGTETPNADMESMVSYADVGRADLSFQARVYISNAINTTSGTRVGIFAHYMKTGPKYYKWALIFQQGNLELVDAWTAFVATVPCPLTPHVWYTLNMTLHGFLASGWASAPGQSPCSVSGTYSASSPAAGGTAFGLYAGGYSALFDDVQVATVSPYVTGSGFSNSFIQNGAPGPVGVNTWLATTKPPGTGWNSVVNWLPASGWSQAYASQNYGATPWGTVTGWPDTGAQWIWWDTNANVSASADNVYFRRVFSVPTTTSLSVTITSDNTYTLYLDGTQLGTGSNWQQPGSYTASVAAGYHVLAIYATNPDGPDAAGLLVSVSNTGNGRVIFRSDATEGPSIEAAAGTAQLTGASSPIFIAGWNSARQNAGSGSTTQTLTVCNIAGGCKAGDTIIVNYWQCCSTGQSLSTVTDTEGNVYAEITLANGANPNSVMADLWGAVSIKADTTSLTVTVTYPDTTHYRAIFVQQYRNVIGVGATHFTGQSSCTSTSESLTTTRANSLVAISFDIGFMTGMSQTGGPSASYDFPYSNSTGWGLFLWDSSIPGVGSNTWIWNVSGCSSGYQSVAVELLGAGNQPIETYYGYAPWGGLTQTKQLYTPPSGQQWLTTSRSYDFYGNSLQFVDARGNSTYYGYSATYGSAYLTNQTQVVGTTKITSLYTYDSNYGTMLSFKDPKGNTTSYQYDQLGRTTQVSYSTGNSNMVANPGFETADFAGWIQTGMIIRANQYHSGQFSAAPTYNGNYPAFTLQEKLPAVSGNSIASIHFWYLYGDPSVDTAQVLYSDGTSTQTTINTVGSWTLETLSFSTAKQIVGVKVTRSATSGENVYLDDFSITTKNDFTSYAYNDAGNYVDITNENGEQTRQIYDGLGRLSIVERFSGGAPYSNQTTSYNWMNLVIKQTDPLGNSTLFQYDALSRPTSVTGPDGNVTTTSYNELSSWVLSTDQYGNHGCKVYDRLGRLVSVVEYSDSNCNPLTLSGYSYVTNYSYDEVGNLLLATTANAQSTGYVYDI